MAGKQSRLLAGGGGGGGGGGGEGGGGGGRVSPPWISHLVEYCNYRNGASTYSSSCTFLAKAHKDFCQDMTCLLNSYNTAATRLRILFTISGVKWSQMITSHLNYKAQV